MALCVKAPSGCWEWIGYRGSKGYGQMRVDGTTVQAHRVAYVLFVDPLLPDELVVDHLCRNHGCVNPMHLDAVSNMENLERGNTSTAKSRLSEVTGLCRRGHRLAETGRMRGNGYMRCSECHSIDEKARRAKRRQEAST